MITGFNTDIEHEGVIYHVQTEDKGVSTPLILSLVYNRGTILASKRSPYDDLLIPAFDEKALSERLQKQHKLICAAVRAGRIEDLKRMNKSSAAAPKSRNIIAQKTEVEPIGGKKETASFAKSANPQTSAVEPKNEKNLPPQQVKFSSTQLREIARENIPTGNRGEQIAPALPKTANGDKAETKITERVENAVIDFPVSIVEEELIIEAVEIIEEEMILSAEAVEIISDFADENLQIADDKLKIRLSDDVMFRSGERKTVGISVFRGGAAAGGAHIMIKVFGAVFRPLIFHAKTDQNGAATVHLQIPQFKGGRASVLIKAMCDGEETELRRTIKQD